ncbi:MAG: OmpA family protein [Flavobacterium sp.]|uniref:OmpA family protein n=1 Tax=Flavobacterium sp. TaxID=239 RepID=UPI0025BB3EB4|nr:OmpA family protein [Flavobacterium sp.]MCA1967448.1 OmpA family protein [Flavobacterium sp.]
MVRLIFIKKIADSYYFNANYPEANIWYEKLIKSTEDVDYEYYYRYSQTLKTVPDLEKSNYYYALFSRLKKADSRAQQFEVQSNYLSQITTDSEHYTVSLLEINSSFSDYGVFESKDGILFTSTRADENAKIDTWTQQPFSGLFSSKLDPSHSFKNPEAFLKNTIFNSNESTAILTKDGLTLYFTRNNFKKNKQKKNNKDEVSLKIYSARFKNGQWTDVVELSFNSDNYNCAHPTLSPDEKTLYFSSNMPGTLGQSDLYRVAILADGKFGAPENLGATINTEGRETFPFLSATGELYFASDGHLGLGGLDVFVSKKNEDASFSKPINLGNPINTAYDDFAYVLNSETRVGYFSSNRPGGKGSDDLYTFLENKSVYDQAAVFSGTLQDALFGTPIANAVVSLFDDSKKRVDKTTTNANGEFVFNNNYTTLGWYLTYEHDSYETKEDYLKTTLFSPLKGPISLLPKAVQLKQGVDLAKFFSIQNIYFDLDQWEITPKAEKQIALLLYVLQQNPELKLEIKSHTDSRASADYNLELSNKRALVTLNWLVSKGISIDRISSRGLGEKEPINHCVDGVSCTEEEHQMNRRSEFIVGTH